MSSINEIVSKAKIDAKENAKSHLVLVERTKKPSAATPAPPALPIVSGA